MPFTFLAHQAVVLPLKLARPRWFDGVALCVASMVPDFAYLVAGTRFGFVSHTAWALLWFVVPVTLSVSAAIRAVAPTWFALLSPRLRRMCVPPGAAPAPVVSLVSALIGGASHVVLDAFTHRRGFVVAHWPALEVAPVTVFGAPVPIYKLLQGPGSLVLAVLALVCLRRLARRAGPVEAAPLGLPARRAFVGVAVAGFVSAAMISIALRAMGGVPAFVIRCACLGFVALVLAAMVARARDSRSIHHTTYTGEPR